MGNYTMGYVFEACFEIKNKKTNTVEIIIKS